jgi:hypothetical protein
MMGAVIAGACSAPLEDEADGPPRFGDGQTFGGASSLPPSPLRPSPAGAPGVPTGTAGTQGESGTELDGTNAELDPAQNGSGGSTASPTPTDDQGAGGSGAAPPASGGAGQPASGEPPPPTNGNCPGEFFCDDFENVAAGASPNPALWQVIANYAPTAQSANVQVSTGNANSGTRAVRVVSANSRNGIVARLPATRYFMRAWLQIDSAPLGPAFIGLGTDQNSETRLRIQGQSFAAINTVGPGDAVRPSAANGGNCPECVRLVPNEWFCAEFFIDEATRAATLWINGVEAAAIVNGEGGWPIQPASPAMFIGSMGLQGGSAGVFIDDVVAGPQRIGCN